MTMTKHITAFIAGLVFALGLALGGMTDPRKVIAFLDITGDWDPSLAFVMGGAIAVYAPLFRRITRRPAPRLERAFHLPTRRDLDAPLVVGAVLFGIGWGLGGFCPGPALVSTMSFDAGAVVFTASMLVAMVLFSAWTRRRTASATTASKESRP
jgi:uncharacterized membrane protein YedE/YeeE